MLISLRIKIYWYFYFSITFVIFHEMVQFFRNRKSIKTLYNNLSFYHLIGIKKKTPMYKNILASKGNISTLAAKLLFCTFVLHY